MSAPKLTGIQTWRARRRAKRSARQASDFITALRAMTVEINAFYDYGLPVIRDQEGR